MMLVIAVVVNSCCTVTDGPAYTLQNANPTYYLFFLASLFNQDVYLAINITVSLRYISIFQFPLYEALFPLHVAVSQKFVFLSNNAAL